MASLERFRRQAREAQRKTEQEESGVFREWNQAGAVCTRCGTVVVPGWFTNHHAFHRRIEQASASALKSEPIGGPTNVHVGKEPVWKERQARPITWDDYRERVYENMSREEIIKMHEEQVAYDARLLRERYDLIDALRRASRSTPIYANDGRPYWALTKDALDEINRVLREVTDDDDDE